jgi:hypothetical protein
MPIPWTLERLRYPSSARDRTFAQLETRRDYRFISKAKAIRDEKQERPLHNSRTPGVALLTSSFRTLWRTEGTTGHVPNFLEAFWWASSPYVSAPRPGLSG